MLPGVGTADDLVLLVVNVDEPVADLIRAGVGHEPHFAWLSWRNERRELVGHRAERIDVEDHVTEDEKRLVLGSEEFFRGVGGGVPQVVECASERVYLLARPLFELERLDRRAEVKGAVEPLQSSAGVMASTVAFEELELPDDSLHVMDGERESLVGYEEDEVRHVVQRMARTCRGRRGAT